MSEPSRATSHSAGHQQRISDTYGRIPLHFEANHGQTDDRVKFVTRGRGYTMFLTANEAVLALSHAEKREAKDRRSPLSDIKTTRTVDRHVLRMKLAGANPNPRVDGQEELPGKANYFTGNDPAKWRTNVPTFARVHYEDVYPGIDLVYYGNQRALEYDFVVQPGADPARIRLGFEGPDRIEVDAKGDLVLHTAQGAIRQRRPFIYQEVNGVRREVSGGYVLRNSHASFQLSGYDPSQRLVIDPTLFYSTFVGGNDDETGIGIAVDADGEAYVTGNVSSLDFPTEGAFDASLNGSSDAYVTKLDATGSALVYSTYLGGSGGDVGLSIAVDGFGSAYVTGITGSSDFPLANPMQANPVGGFVTKLSPTGSALVYSTYNEPGRGIAVDLAGSAYVAGGGSDATVQKLDPTGSVQVYRILFGGTSTDMGFGVAVDATGAAYVAGNTSSMDFPTTPGSAQPTFGGFIDAFVSKIDPSGTTLVYSTYLGGSEFDGGTAIAIDTAGNAYVTGFTPGADFPTVNAFQPTFGGGGADAFVSKLNAGGTALVYSTYLGGSEVEEGRGIAVDAAGSAFVLGRTASDDFPTISGSFQDSFGGVEDSFVTRLSPDGSQLLYSTYLGGSAEDANNGAIALDDFLNPNAYVVGSTSSSDFPTTEDAFDTTYNGGAVDVFIAQIIDVMLPPEPTTGRVRGQGVVPVPGGTGRFHLIVRRQTDGTLNGRVQYRNRVTDAQMKSETITSLVITANAARIDGTCGTLCTFTVEVTDVDDGPNDTFTISINGGPPEGGTLQKGNIRIEQ